MPFLDNPTTQKYFLDKYGQPIKHTSALTQKRPTPPLLTPTESYNDVLPLDVVAYNQPGIIHDSYEPDPRIPVKESSTKESYKNGDDISNMLYGMSFHHDEHHFQDNEDSVSQNPFLHDDNTIKTNRRGPQ